MIVREPYMIYDKIVDGESLTPIDELVLEISNGSSGNMWLSMLEECLKNAYIQGVSDSKPVWLSMEEFDTTHVHWKDDFHNYSKWVLVVDSYDNVTQARYWWTDDGSSNWLDRGGNVVFPMKWLPLPRPDLN